MIDSRKTVDIPFPQFSLKILKKHLLKAWFTWLIYISLYFLPHLIFAETSTCNSARFNLSVTIFLIPLLPSSSVKISFSNTLLASETTFRFKSKISIALCWPISRDTKNLFTLLTIDVKPCRLFSWKNFIAATRVWSKINYGEESTSSQTFNYFLCMFSDMTVTDLVEKFKMPVWKRLGRGTHSQNRNEPNSRTFSKLFPHYKFQIQRFNCKISPGLAQLVNRAASTTGYDSTNKALFFQMLWDIVFI